MVLVAPKLSGASLSGQLLKHLAKCQMDEVPAIRVNTNICLGKIAGHLEPGVSISGTVTCGTYCTVVVIRLSRVRLQVISVYKWCNLYIYNTLLCTCSSLC